MLPLEGSQDLHMLLPLPPSERHDAMHESPAIIPNEASQALYNRMKAAEALASLPHPCPPGKPTADEETLTKVLPGREDEPDLKPSAVSQQPSSWSQASSNGRNGGGGRAKRDGPLPDFVRAKAAFMRNVGACSDCRRRRVGCQLSHGNFSLFEKQYRQQRRQCQRNQRNHRNHNQQHRPPQENTPAVGSSFSLSPPSCSPCAFSATASAAASSLGAQEQKQLDLMGLGSQLNFSLPENAHYKPTINDDFFMPGPPVFIPDDVETSLRIRRLHPSQGGSNMVLTRDLVSDGSALNFNVADDTDANFSAASTMDGVEGCHHPCANLSHLSGRRPNVDVFQPSSGTHTSSDFARSFKDHFAPPWNNMGYYSSNNQDADGGRPSEVYGQNDGDAAYYEDGFTPTDGEQVSATDMSHSWAFD